MLLPRHYCVNTVFEVRSEQLLAIYLFTLYILIPRRSNYILVMFVEEG